ncbi:MAG TPA: glutamine--tRNA ligase/YqeY domain fusion protein [Treponema sp.]|nr:glutamine--tRNA ligase/YqeY domain fusion protein [Treponema sp.]HRS05021.1 glutamine--tRNA ligase/YqeY domain fusion protein [Treponema sp.]HRU29013.1 glutamine--tRNA ligase/YqeY domain fusion protein [Treponema sp.]
MENNEFEKPESSDFISEAIAEDLKNGRFDHVHTRFPPEPNGWLHIGHAKAISVDFTMAQKFGGKCNLRFDDTNPEKEDMSYVEAIKRDIKWLGYDWEDREYYASDYYEYLYELAVKLIKKGKAYVDDLSDEEIRVYRGTAVPDKNNITYTPPGKDSPYRNRSVEENLDLFARMRAGEFPDGSKTLRAKIDMAHPNLVMRDPVMYRIRRMPHYRVGNAWCIYPMYDFQHPLSDAKEGITHSLCSLEYEIHRPLYEWFIRECEVFPSRQIEFARLNITRTVLSKRWLLQLVNEKRVAGWDDPRMPTLAGLRRRGYTPEAIRDFMSRIGIAKTDSMVDIALLEHCLREDLNKRANRVMAVLKPIKLIIENWPEDKVEELEAVNNPEDPNAGTRKVHFTRELWIEQDDFQEVPPPKYFRLFPGNSVRLRYGYIVTCTGFDKDPVTGQITAVRCTYDPETRGGNAQDNRKVKGTIHWVSVKHAIPIEVRLYDYLFAVERPMDVPPGGSFLDNLNPNSLEVIPNAYGEPCLADTKAEDKFQFERIGYFVRDPDNAGTKPVFNKTVGLRDTWAKIEKKTQGQ